MYSHSRLSSFENCPLQFKFKYIDKLSTGITTIEAFLGSRVHEALEKLYKDKQFHKLLSEQELLDYFRVEWDKLFSDQVKIIRKDYTADNYRQMGVSYLKNYYKRHHPFNQSQTIGLELYIIINLPSGKKIQGYIDRLSEHDGIYEIHDYKTSNTLPAQDKADQDRQLALYAVAVKHAYKDAKVVRLIWHYLAFNKEIVSTRTDDQLSELLIQTDTLIEEIECTTEFEAKVSSLCDWCEFRSICPKWAHLAALETQEPLAFKADQGVQLADSYAELTAKKKVLDEQISTIKDQLYTFAQQHNVDTVFGSNLKLRLWQGTNYSFPSPDTLERKQLVQELRRIGLLKDFLTLDTWKLSKHFKNLDGISRASLSRFAKESVVKKIYPSTKP